MPRVRPEPALKAKEIAFSSWRVMNEDLQANSPPSADGCLQR
jgi:hypothetical protein